jgi:enoyl-[acyl-carrier protein] reductase I
VKIYMLMPGYHVVGMKAVDAPDIDVVTGRKE